MAIQRICSVADCGKPACNGRGWCWGHYKKEMKSGAPRGCGIGTPHGEPMAWINTHANYTGTDCLKWPYTTNGNGRGLVWFRHRMNQAARVMCTIVHGEPPTPQHQAAHNCGKGDHGCMNPLHLRWATASENQLDRVAHGTTIRGSRHPSAKLTENDVRDIRRLHGKMERKDIAEMFGVHPMTVHLVTIRKTWAWLE